MICGEDFCIIVDLLSVLELHYNYTCTKTKTYLKAVVAMDICK
jgi:hypothetical protein